jgi:hypothetical protein
MVARLSPQEIQLMQSFLKEKLHESTDSREREINLRAKSFFNQKWLIRLTGLEYDIIKESGY